MTSNFTFRKSWADAAEKIADQQERMHFYEAIIKYALFGEVPKFENDLSDMAFVFVKAQIDEANEKKQYGKKGGRPRKDAESFSISTCETAFSLPEAEAENSVNDSEDEKPSENLPKTMFPQKKEKGFSPDKKEKVSKKKELTLLSQKIENNPPISPQNGGIEPAEEESHKGSIYNQIQAMYNKTCVSYPKCKVLSAARRRAINARMNSGYTLEAFQELFRKAEESPFLKGKNKNNWRASFDWLIADSNMAKVLDGNYDNVEMTENDPPPKPTVRKSHIEWIDGEAVTVFE